MKLSRIPGRKRTARVMTKGKQWKGKHMAVHFLSGAPKHPLIDPKDDAVYLGIMTSAKLAKSAVKRNRMRRRVRESFRTYLQEHDAPTIQLLVRPRSSSLMCDYSEIRADVRAFFSSLT